MELTHAKRPLARQTPSQTLGRGLDVLEQVALGDSGLVAIAARLGLSRTTVHRLASNLVERRYLNLTPRRGYSLGPKLLELGCMAREQITLVRTAAPIMEKLAEETGDAVLLSVRENEAAVIVGCAAGRRSLTPRLRVGERRDVRRSAAGLALLLDACADELAALFTPRERADAAAFAGTLLAAAASGIVLDDPLGATEIATMAAPVRGADGRISAAIGLAMAAPYREAGMAPAARAAVLRASASLSAELGWTITNAHDGVPGNSAARELLGNGVTAGMSGGAPDNVSAGSQRPAARAKRRGKAAVAATTIL